MKSHLWGGLTRRCRIDAYGAFVELKLGSTIQSGTDCVLHTNKERYNICWLS